MNFTTNNFNQRNNFSGQLCVAFLLGFNFLSLSSLPSLSATKTNSKPDTKIITAPKVVPAKKEISPKQPSVKPEAAKSEKVEVIKNEVKNCSKEISIKELIGNPEAWLNKEVCFSGTFSSFSALALDYPAALRERKNHISITLLRPKTKIPLGELKLAMKIEEAQKHELLPKITEGDEVKIKGKVFSAALGEPWLDIVQIQVTKGPNSEDSEENPFEGI